ncbi:hypothetical protein BD770DRAFT_166367 [Pilaira anomala]|nr:hypothetical protein BD770DRAFT_166367 [Pilaira anomala]
MNQTIVRTTIIIQFAYHHTTQSHYHENAVLGLTSTRNTTNAGKSPCAVCGSQLHMTKHCPVHP